jgi:hypothetical protein
VVVTSVFRFNQRLAAELGMAVPNSEAAAPAPEIKREMNPQ